MPGEKMDSRHDGHVHDSRKRLFSKNQGKQSTGKPRHSQGAIPKKQLHASSINGVKKRIRDISRTLTHSEELPADVKIENERALAAYQQELQDAEELKEKNKMIKKYHMVRFFERQKATRILRKLRKTLAETQDAEEKSQIEQKIHIAEVDLNYTQYFPLNQAYISIYPKTGPKEDEQREPNEQHNDPNSRPPMWAEIERRMEEGNQQSLDQLRNGVQTRVGFHPRHRPPKNAPAAPKHMPDKKANETPSVQLELDPTLNRRERRRAMGVSKKGTPAMAADSDENMSDGGFFEE